jgi:lauroyl/myristoyl acyltransferase
MTNRIIQWIQRMDYRHGLPIMAKMPFFIGVFASYCRGLLQALTDYDWRSIALGRKYIRSQVYQAMTALTGGRPKNVKAVLGRFLHNSRSEYQDSLYLYEKKIEEVCRNSKVNGIEAYVKAQKSGRGIVLLTCHFDSFILGIVLLGKHGLKTNLLSSAVVEDSLVHPDVKTFFYQKYRRMEKFIGGKIIHFETGLDFYYKVLARGEALVIVSDVQGSKTDVLIPFLGRSFRMPVGAWRMAKETNSLVGAYICRYISPGVYQMDFLPPKEIDRECPVNTLSPVYVFFEERIRKNPERWLAAEHWIHYGR